MRPKKICVEKDQQISDDVDKNRKKVVINSLDYELLAKIIMLLPVPERIEMEKVCTKWKEACQLAWYDIKKYKCEPSIGRSYDNGLLTQSYLKEILLRCGVYLKELSLSNVCNSKIMPFIGDHCKNLTTLECKFYDNSFIDRAYHFVQAFRQLDKLKCIKIRVDHNYSNETINLSQIINSLPEEINEIHLISEPRLNQKQNISMSVKKFKNLQKLTVHSFNLDNIILQEISDITTLVYLSLQPCDINHEFPLFNKLINLEYIDLTMVARKEANKLSTKILNTICCTCKNLKHLDMPPGPYDLVKIPLEKWINFQHLEYLGISCDIMPDLANTIVEYCKNLKHLKLHNPDDLMNETALKKLTELENLESLILLPCMSLIEESIITISNNFKKLKRLEFIDCKIVSSVSGRQLFYTPVFNELSKLQYLEHLNLSGTNNFKDSTIISIAYNCKNLKSLKIYGAGNNITETVLIALTSLENLQFDYSLA
ncbi:hypothetical protein HCN44_005555 [Aphidius gifuensis]|uniref:F-box domain-containing protein n=1 Tax=Aphidius gifuensis TaxID=684658 RepID=A0A835CXA3_APHGI|nr:uncharacterized protein LOC122847681 isoform X2 [Aphidius gifuensis]KAF7997278.1 hypothetical protein HCN44_005555 [Aphidius gifuensis]